MRMMFGLSAATAGPAKNARAPKIVPIAFRDLYDQQIYILVTGRWFRAPDLAGPWKHVPGRDLPVDFALIADTSPKENVKASVPGTAQSQETEIAAQIPTQATVARAKARFTPVVTGAPILQPVPDTPLSYVFNSPQAILRVSASQWYAVENGLWFTAASLSGPWSVASKVPAVIYSIPPNSPLYYVTFVKVYAATPQYVVVGYTPGYMGVVVAPDGMVVYGTGYTYVSYVGTTVWYPAPVTYGYAANVTYTPWTGFAVGFAVGWGVAAHYCYAPAPYCISFLPAARRCGFGRLRSLAGGIRLELPHHLFNAEAGRLLARREFLEARDPLADEYLSRHEQEDTSGVPVDIVRGVVLGFLEGVAPQVEEERHSQLDEGLGPHLEALRALLLEDHLPVFVAQRHQVAVIAPVEELLARPFPALALQIRQQVVAIEVDLEGLVSRAVALPQLDADVGIADRGEERRQHVLVGGDLVDERPRLDHPGPTDDARHPPGALPVRVLFTAERCRASVGPGEHLGAIVGSIQDDGVVGDAEIVELLEQLADHAVVLDH